jgi:hypothetical protein
MRGVAESSALQETILIAGAAGVVAGPIAWDEGGYGQVCSPSEVELAGMGRETRKLTGQTHEEMRDLATTYRELGTGR